MFQKRIKVLYPVLHYPPVIGGLEQWTQNIAEKQSLEVADTAEIKIVVVTGRVKGAPDFEERRGVKIFRASLFELKDLSHSSWVYIFSSAPFIFWRSLWLIFAQKIDLIHCHGFVSTVIGYVLSIISGRPFIGTEQSLGWGNGKSRWLRSVVYKKARLCIAASRAVAEEFKKLGVDRIKIIPNGIDLTVFRPCDEQCTGFPPPHVKGFTPHITILSIGRLEKVKGHKYLIEAFALVKKEIPSAKLMLIGDGSERASLEKQAKELDVRDLVEFAGEVPHDELPHWYHQADMFVMPSLSEGFGIAAIEAMASGLPVIATRAGSLAELVSDKQNGLLIPPGDASSLAGAIKLVFVSPSLAASLAEEAVKRAQRYSWDKIASGISSIYRKAVPPKILTVASIFPPKVGGPAYYASNLLREFKNLGITTDVLTGKSAWSFRAIFLALRGFDICYVLSASPKILIPAFLAAKLRRKKLALRIGGDFLWERAFEEARTDLPLRLFYQQYKKSFCEKFIFTTLGFLFRRCDYIIFSSDSLRELYVKIYKLQTLRVHTIENPYLDAKKVQRSFPRDLSMLYAGRLVKLKNVELLLEVVKELKEELGRNVELKIIGEGPQLRRLKNLSQKLVLQDVVIFQETLTQAALLEEIKVSWLVVLPSLSDITPNLVYESCAVGTPVVVTRENFLPAKVLEGLITFDPNNKSELKMAALSLNDPQRWQAYQQRIFDLDTSRSFAHVAREHVELFFPNDVLL